MWKENSCGKLERKALSPFREMGHLSPVSFIIEFVDFVSQWDSGTDKKTAQLSRDVMIAILPRRP